MLGEYEYFTDSPYNYITDYSIHVDENGIVVEKTVKDIPEIQKQKFEISKSLLTLLTRNQIINNEPEIKKQYLKIISLTIADALHFIKNEFSSKLNESVFNDIKSNVKFMNWIAPSYNIPTRKSVRIKKTGKGCKVPQTPIILSPFANENKKRLYLILTSKEAGNNSGLEEFTAILDQLLKNEEIKLKDYKGLLKRFNST